jgi:hypothetical protein
LETLKANEKEQSNPNHKLLRSQETLEEHLEYLKKVGLWE